MGDDAAMRVLLPVGRSAHAILAGYLGLFAVLVFPAVTWLLHFGDEVKASFGLFALVVLPAPLALLFGALAVRDIRRSRSNPQPKYGMGRAIFGIVMGALGTAVLVTGLVSVLSGGS
jgi:hypothetical protein